MAVVIQLPEKLITEIAEVTVRIGHCIKRKARSCTQKASYERSHDLLLQSMDLMAKIRDHLTTEERDEIVQAVELVLQCQKSLTSASRRQQDSRARKDKTKEFARVTTDLDERIRMTSDAVICDLSMKGMKAEAYRLYVACGHAELNPTEMIQTIQKSLSAPVKSKQSTDSKKQPQPNKKKSSAEKLPTVLMREMADFLEQLEEN